MARPALGGGLASPADAGGRRSAPLWAAVAGILALAFNLRLAVSSVPPVLGHLGLSRPAEAALTAIPVVCFGVAALAHPVLESRLAPARLPAAFLSLLLTGLLVRAVFPSRGLFAGTVVACLGLALLNVQVPVLVHRFAPGHLGAMTGAYTVVMAVGGAAAAGLTLPAAELGGGHAQAGLAVWILPAVIALGAWLPWALGGSEAESRPAPTLAGMLALLRLPAAWVLTLFFGVQSLIFYAVISWTPTIYAERGIAPAAAGGLLAWLTLAGVLGNVLGPLLATRVTGFPVATAAMLGTLAAGLAGVAWAGTAAPLLWMTLAGAGLGGAFSLALLRIVQQTAAAEGSSGFSTVAQGVGYLLAATGPLALGLLRVATGGWTVPLLSLIALAVLEAVLGFLLSARVTRARRQARPDTTRSHPRG